MKRAGPSRASPNTLQFKDRDIFFVNSVLF